jgi:VIT1/CCC1 family predicted Fe2+/Mn2+ transporter
MRPRHPEFHRVTRIGWLRAAVLGANDGILSTASVVLGVAAAQGTRAAVLVACVAALVGGAMSMAAGEYVSVSSQADTERADLERERRELAKAGRAEHEELAGIYRERGLTPALATEVARQLDALGAHARDELGIAPDMRARPVQAALASAASFAAGAALPLLVVSITPLERLLPVIVMSTLVALAVLGAVAARAGGAPVLVGATRVVVWGALAMAVTAGIGTLVGVRP